jgi:hypothetical protein
MAKETRDPRTATTPTRFAETTPPQSFPSGDYTYILEIVMNMQVTMGKLVEAVDSLKGVSKSHAEKLDQIGKDVHASKVVVGVVGGLILAVGAVIAWLVNTYISTHPAK